MKKYTLLLLVCIWLMVPLHSEIVAPNVGHTQVFNVLGQGFFVGYYPITATCQKIGNSYYIFTEDVRVNDIAISPVSPDTMLISTTSGLYITYDGGSSWRFASGSGTNIIAPDYNGAGYDEAEIVLAHRTTVEEAFIMKDGEWWCGYLDGVFQSVDGGVKWTSKTRGIPSYYSTADEETVYPPFYKIVWDSQVADYAANTDFYACSQAGLFYWSKSKFINLGGGLPKTSGDWNHFSVFDFANTADAAYIGTELGVYKATVDIAKAQANWMPLGGASVSIDSSEYDTKASELLLYVSGVDQNTYVNIVDSVKSVYWSAKVKKFNDLLCVAISVENLYFSDAAVFDPGTLDYANYAVTDVTVKQPSNISVSRIYIDANDAVYYQSENGIYRISGTDAAELVYEFSADIHDFTVHDGTMYAGTGAGLYSSDMTDLMNWTKETGYLSEGSTDGDTLDYDVRSIAFNPDGDMFLGCHTGGLIKRDASGNWSNLNIGLSYRNITPEKVNYVAAAFDSLDLHTTVSEWFGDYPDMDGDAKQYCLLVDLQDLYYLDAGDGVTFLDAVFDPNDQLSKSVSSSSNEMDLIYIDTDPLNLTSADTYAGIANALTTEIIQTQEAPEEEWVVKGLGELGEWIAGLKNATQTYTMGSNNNLLLIGDLSPEVNDYRYNFVFFDYLYSHYLNTEEKMKAYIALAETGMEGIEAALAELGGPTFKELYNDFSKAIHFDMLTLSNIDAKYIFPDINVTHGSRIFDWGFGSSNSPYITPQTAWSTIYYVTTGWDNAGYFWCPDFSGTVTFNGEDGTSYEFSTIKQSGTSFDYALVDLDDTQYGANSDMIDFGRADTNDHSRPYQLLYFIVNVHETPDPAGTAHVIHDEVIDTDEFSIGFNHNTGAPDYLNMFCYTSTRIYDDAGKAGLYDLDGDAVPDIEGPAGYLILDGDTTDISLAQFYINAAESDYVYSRTIDLSAIDTDISSVRIDLFGENLSSAGVAVSTSGTLAKINSAKRDITVSENATVTFPESAVTGQKQISVFLSKGDLVKQFRIESELDAPISDILFIGPEDLKIHKPVKIRMPLNSGKSAPEADIIPIVFRREKNRLVPLTQAEIMADGSVLFEAGQLGSYQVYLAKESVLSEETRIPMAYALRQNYPNPFNSSTAIRYQLPRSGDLRIDIYNLTGQKVRTLYSGAQVAGYHTIEWNGLSDANRLLPSGVYIYRMKSSEFTATEKMMYLK